MQSRTKPRGYRVSGGNDVSSAGGVIRYARRSLASTSKLTSPPTQQIPRAFVSPRWRWEAPAYGGSTGRVYETTAPVRGRGRYYKRGRGGRLPRSLCKGEVCVASVSLPDYREAALAAAARCPYAACRAAALSSGLLTSMKSLAIDKPASPPAVTRIRVEVEINAKPEDYGPDSPPAAGTGFPVSDAIAAADDVLAARRRRSPGFARADALPGIHRLTTATEAEAKSPSRRGRSFSAPGGSTNKPSDEVAVGSPSESGETATGPATVAHDLPYIDSVSSETDVVFAPGADVSERTLAEDSGSMPEDEETVGSRFSMCDQQEEEEWPFDAVVTEGQRTRSDRYLDASASYDLAAVYPGPYKSAEYLSGGGYYGDLLSLPTPLSDEQASTASDESECTQCYSDHPISEFRATGAPQPPVGRARSEGGIAVVHCDQCDEVVVLPVTPRSLRGVTADVGSSRGMLLTDDDVDDFELDDDVDSDAEGAATLAKKLTPSQSATVDNVKEGEERSKTEWAKTLEKNGTNNNSNTTKTRDSREDIEMAVVSETELRCTDSIESGTSTTFYTRVTDTSDKKSITSVDNAVAEGSRESNRFERHSVSRSLRDSVRKPELVLTAARASRPRTLQGLQCNNNASSGSGGSVSRVIAATSDRTDSNNASSSITTRSNCELPRSDVIQHNSGLPYREQMNCFPF